jgi:hypothetical protein
VSARRGTAGGLLGVLLLSLLAAPALAAEDPASGYWTRVRDVGAPVPVQPPDPVPEGGTWVSGDPAGPVAVSALRAEADAGSVVTGFRLPVADSLGPPAVLVCPTTERWAPEQGGRLEAAPAADCSAPVETALEEDVLVIDLPPELQGDTVDVLLTPAPGSAFSITFERATAESVVQAPESSGGPLQPVPVPPPATGTAPPPTFDDGGFAGGFSGGTDVGVPELGDPVGGGSEPLLAGPSLPEVAPEAGPAPQTAPPAAQATLSVRRPAAAPVDRTASLMAVALLVGLGALAARLAVQPAVAPRHLGGGARLTRGAAAAPGAGAGPAAVAPAGASPRGVGRFRSPRVRPPVRI